MFALILRHKSTPPGIIIIHDTHDPVLVGETPLSRTLLNDYVKGFRFFIYDRTVFKRREKIVTSKNLEAFMTTGKTYYAFAKMTLEQRSFPDLDMRNILVDDSLYELGEIQHG